MKNSKTILNFFFGFLAASVLFSLMSNTNNTKDEIKVREIVFQESVWSPPLVNRIEVDRSIMETESEWNLSSTLDVKEVLDKTYRVTNEKYGTDIKPDVSN